MKKLTVGILGVPFDYGIKLVGGRPGARFGPARVKREFFKLIKKQRSKEAKKQRIQITDYGNVKPVSRNPKKTHQKVTKAVQKIIKDDAIPIVIGGGHDISFASIKAIALAYKKIGAVNLDAHYDVRPVVDGKINSGTPFRRLLDGKYLSGKNFVELGIHSPKNLVEHYKYLIQKKATLLKLNSVNSLGINKLLDKAFKIACRNTKGIVLDIDIDGIQKRFAPGCSAPCVKGFTKKQVLQAAYNAGKNKDVKLFNLMEVSPPYDVRNKTVKLGAKLIFYFIRGLSERRE